MLLGLPGCSKIKRDDDLLQDQQDEGTKKPYGYASSKDDDNYDDDNYDDDEEEALQADDVYEALIKALKDSEIATQADLSIVCQQLEPVLQAVKANQNEKATSSPPKSNKPKFLWVYAHKAPIKPAPDNNSKTISYVGYGQKVPVVSKINGWVHVGGSQYIRIDKLTDRRRFQKKISKIKYVKAPDLNVRAAPDSESTIVDRLTKGERVIVLSNSKDSWVKIGHGRYVNSKHLIHTRKEIDWAH
jgi:hypothetical protein